MMGDFDKISTDLSNKVEAINSGYKNTFDGAVSKLVADMTDSKQKTIENRYWNTIFVYIFHVNH